MSNLGKAWKTFPKTSCLKYHHMYNNFLKYNIINAGIAFQRFSGKKMCLNSPKGTIQSDVAVNLFFIFHISQKYISIFHLSQKVYFYFIFLKSLFFISSFSKVYFHLLLEWFYISSKLPICQSTKHNVHNFADQKKIMQSWWIFSHFTF